jgi:hypothetical protein
MGELRIEPLEMMTDFQDEPSRKIAARLREWTALLNHSAASLNDELRPELCRTRCFVQGSLVIHPLSRSWVGRPTQNQTTSRSNMNPSASFKRRQASKSAAFCVPDNWKRGRDPLTR